MLAFIFGIIGPINEPDALQKFAPVESGGLGQLINILLNTMIVGGAIYALFNFVLAGYAFMSADNDPKAIAGAWAKIWQSALGLTVAAGTFILGALFGRLIFGSSDALINPIIPIL
jgi:hypothetical protein